jgi:hypothetical protein
MTNSHFGAMRCIHTHEIWSRPRLFVMVFVCLAINVRLSGQEAQPQTLETSASRQTHDLKIQDGTRVSLRFAQPVYGLAVAAPGSAIEKGAQVRLVVGSDVRVDDKIVVAKGALAQATVMRVWLPKCPPKSSVCDPVFAGLSLRLDWVMSVTGAQVPLRALREGRGKAFDVDVHSAKGGIEVSPFHVVRNMFLAPLGADLFSGRAFHQKQWIPAGARMTAFLDGDVTLRAAELEQAQASLPTSNLSATLYIFRTKNRDGPSPPVSCDQAEVGSLGSRQSAVAALAPGKHSCRSGTSPPIELTVDGGNDYYLWLRHAGTSDTWELKPVSIEEGEDRTANTEMLPPRPAVNKPHE